MDKIRIGNDISLRVSLYTKIKEPLNIHSIQAFLMNDTLSKDSFFGNTRYDRFPNEPNGCYYASTEYDICQTGKHQYNTLPHNIVCKYNGFGVYPHTFEQNICTNTSVCDNSGQFTEYRARIEQTKDVNTVYVYFPAEDQITCGVYNLIIVAKCYQPGYSKYTQFKTVTVCYNNVFELVSADYSGNDIADQTTLEVGISQVGGTGDNIDVHAISGELNDSGILTINLNNGLTTDQIDLNSMLAWYKTENE